MAEYGSTSFEEQIEFFKRKLNLPTERWDDIWEAAHDKAFIVAGAMDADLLKDLKNAIAKAIGEGTTLETFRNDFEDIVAKQGWTGWTGEDTEDGRAWRTRVIYETNLRTSYAAGRYAQLQAIKARRPYWRYRHNDTVRFPREQHVAWDGLILPADDPWWSTHYPPNGWGCFTAETPVRCNALLGLRTLYAGEMVELHTRLGHRLTVTVNHPVLTPDGWVPAGQLEQGSQLIGACGPVDAAVIGVVDDQEPPPSAEDLFKSLQSQGFRTVPMSPHDFHGDALLRKPEIDIAGSDSALLDVLQAAQRDSVTDAGNMFRLLADNPGATEDEVTGARKFLWRGAVFDFVTQNGLILAGGIAVSNCRCYIESLAERDLERMGKSGPDPSPGSPLDPKTSQPIGIDPGWGYAPGATTAETLDKLIRDKAAGLEREDPELSKQYLASLQAGLRTAALLDLIGQLIEQAP